VDSGGQKEAQVQSYKPKTNANEKEQPQTRMWSDAQRDGRPAEYRWRPLLNAAKFG